MKAFVEKITANRVKATLDGDDAGQMTFKLVANRYDINLFETRLSKFYSAYGRLIMRLTNRKKYRYLPSSLDPSEAKIKRIVQTIPIVGEFDTKMTEYETKPKWITDDVPGEFSYNINVRLNYC